MNGNWNSSTVIFTLEANKTYKIITASNAPIHIVNVNQIIKTWVNGTTYTPNENVEVTELILAVDLGKTFNNVLATPMIYEYDGTDKPYEEYGAMPSLDYPSEVEAVGDNVNMFDKDNANKINATPSAGTIIESSNGKSFYLGIKPNTDYSISRKIVGQRFTACTTTQVPAVGVSTNQKVQNNTGNEIHIKAGENDKYLLVYYLYNSSENEEEILSSIKIEEGTEATTYSPYGQGSVEVKKINKNYYDVGKSINDYFVTAGSKGATITQYNASNYVECDIIEGIMNIETYNTSGWNWIAKWLKINKNTNYTISLNKSTTSLTVLGFNSVETGITGDVIAELVSTNSKTTFNSGNYEYYAVSFYPRAGLEIAIQVEAGDLNTNFEEYQEQSYILDIQKPMLLGDYFDLERGKEVHKWIERELTGTENITLTDTVNGIAQFTFSQFYDGDYDRGYVNINALSNCYKGVPFQSSWLKDNSIALVGGYTARIMTSEYSTVEEFKQMLAEKYAEGNPVKIYYKLIKPKELGLTEEQKSVLQQLSELPLFKGTNNIITAESLALLQMSYIADTQSYIDSKLNNINQQILELAGGN